MTDKPPNVRIAIPGDEDAIFKIFTMAHAENGMGDMDERRVKDTLAFATRRQGGVIGVIDGPDGLEGCIFMLLSQWWYSNGWHWEELINFVHPDHRRSTHAKNLIEFAKWWAEQMKMPLFIGILTTQRLEAKVRLYQRQLTHGGAVFYHNYNGVQ